MCSLVCGGAALMFDGKRAYTVSLAEVETCGVRRCQAHISQGGAFLISRVVGGPALLSG